ncbi:MAG TPA: nucleotidyltransferase family protein [Candidatus Dormibacteraeota bacterium]|nr:nucleotidyltransferase family protein [Candidatus Dormibacteraeota bacterium]
MRSAGIVLAAGSSTRMGRPKQLLPVNGRPLLQLVVEQACAARLDEVLVVLGAQAEEVRARVDMGRARVVVNPDHESGMASSLRCGVAALGKEVARLVVILGDQPTVTSRQIDQLLDLHRSSGLPAAALSFDGLLHPPVVLGRDLWPALSSLEGDVGCRAIIRARPDQVAALPVPDAHRHPVDIDTPQDYERLIGASPEPPA